MQNKILLFFLVYSSITLAVEKSAISASNTNSTTAISMISPDPQLFDQADNGMSILSGSTTPINSYGAYFHGLYSGNSCQSTNTNPAIYNTMNIYKVTTVITVTNDPNTPDIFANHSLYNEVWNIIAAAQSADNPPANIPTSPGNVNFITAALVTAPTGINGITKMSNIAIDVNKDDTNYNNAIAIQDINRNSCLPIKCNDTNHTCVIAQASNLYVGLPPPQLPGGTWKNYCDMTRTTYDGKTLNTYCSKFMRAGNHTPFGRVISGAVKVRAQSTQTCSIPNVGGVMNIYCQ